MEKKITEEQFILLFGFKKNIGVCTAFIVFMINLANLEINYQRLSLSLSWTCQRNRVSLIVKFGLNKNNFIEKKNDNNVANSREVNKKSKFSVIYIYIYIYIYIRLLQNYMKFGL